MRPARHEMGYIRFGSVMDQTELATIESSRKGRDMPELKASHRPLEILTLRLTREPGWEGRRLILFRLMSRISRDGITVSWWRSFSRHAVKSKMLTYDVGKYGKAVVLED